MMIRAVLLICLSWCVVCVPVVSVQRGQNVSLPCLSDLMTSSSGLAWFRLRSAELTLLISATRGKLLKNNQMIVVHNEEPSRFRLEAGQLGAGHLEVGQLGAGHLEVGQLGAGQRQLVISAVSDADLGLYFCATTVGLEEMRFGPAIRLTLTGSERLSDGIGCPALSISISISICVCVCVCVSAALCYRRGSVCSSLSRVKQNCAVSPAGPVQYSSLRFIQRSRTPAPTAAPTPAPADETYATIAKHTR